MFEGLIFLSFQTAEKIDSFHFFFLYVCICCGLPVFSAKIPGSAQKGELCKGQGKHPLMPTRQ